MYTIDDSLPFMLNIFLAQFAGLIATIGVTCYGLPYFAILLIPLSVFYYYTQVNDVKILIPNFLTIEYTVNLGRVVIVISFLLWQILRFRRFGTKISIGIISTNTTFAITKFKILRSFHKVLTCYKVKFLF